MSRPALLAISGVRVQMRTPSYPRRRVESVAHVRAVLDTGASGGIGAAVAHRFAENGDRVAVHYATNGAGADETRRSLPARDR